MTVALCATLVGAACIPMPVGRFADMTATVKRTNSITYTMSIDEHGIVQAQQLDLFVPTTKGSSRPAIVFVHGGGFTSGSRAEQAGFARDFAARGYVTATIDYRVREGEFIWFNTPIDEAMSAVVDARRDAQDSIRWLRRNAGRYGVDPERIAIVGYSAGAITALGVAQHSDDAIVAPDESAAVCLAVSISGAALEGPIDRTDAPMVLLHGADDIVIPTRLAHETAWKAAAVDRLARYIEFPAATHMLPFERSDEVTAAMVGEIRDRVAMSPHC